MAAYYNEIDPYAAQWLRNLIAAGHIAAGDVDERSIVDVSPDDLRGYTKCHFFAGIGGWSLALRLAGWPDDRPVWTGSCPCQPFSTAGKQRGSEDERHLWPAFFRLIRERRPAAVFGEQVAGAAGLAWLDHVCADLESVHYAVAAADMPACSVGAPHRRQRLWWVADADKGRFEVQCEARIHDHGQRWDDSTRCGTTVRLADPEIVRCAWHWRGQAEQGQRGTDQRCPSAWSAVTWIDGKDGSRRPTQPGLFPLAHGIPGRVGRLRAYGNAIVPQVAAEFIAAAAV
jgi:DNA (cytosine-5)-methyltransferase 1